MRTKTHIFLFTALGFALGLLVSAPLNYYKAITFEPRFHFGHVIASVTTLLVAVLVTSFLQRTREDDRKEKELLLRLLDELQNLLFEFEKFKDGGKLTEIATSLKKLSMKCLALQRVLEELHYPARFRSAADFTAQIHSIRKLSTGTPIRKIEKLARTSKCTSEVRDGIIELASEKRALLDTTIQEMKTNILKAQLCINRK